MVVAEVVGGVVVAEVIGDVVVAEVVVLTPSFAGTILLMHSSFSSNCLSTRTISPTSALPRHNITTQHEGSIFSKDILSGCWLW